MEGPVGAHLLETWAKQEADVIIIGAGVSGSFMAQELTRKGLHCVVLEAGRHYPNEHYPSSEIDATAQLYWSGGIEFNATADLGFLRPKVVGGGSIVNQALVDRFDELAWSDWKKESGISFFRPDAMAPFYERAEASLAIQEIPAEFRNGNARIFEEGFKKNGYRCAPLKRAQSGCYYEDGNDCIECLAGCRVQSKQSMPWTTLDRAEKTGKMTLISEAEVTRIREDATGVSVEVVRSSGLRRILRAKRCVLASGAVGNSKLLIQSGWNDRLPMVGKHFYTHPQYMTLAIFPHTVHSEKGPFQAFKSDDPGFRQAGFKLENVYAPPASLAMLIPGVGMSHQKQMRKMDHFACIEVAVRDTEPGTITVNRSGKVIIEKRLNAEDRKRARAGQDCVNRIFQSTGAQEVIPGVIGIGLHLMGGARMGSDIKNSVVGPDFRIHGSKRVFAADSSVFPLAPGINPSLTIMALAIQGAEEVARA